MIISKAFQNLSEERIGRTPVSAFYSRLILEYSPAAGQACPISGQNYTPVSCNMYLSDSETQITDAQWDALYVNGSAFPTWGAIRALITGNVTEIVHRVQLLQTEEGRTLLFLPASLSAAPALPQISQGATVGHCVLAIRNGDANSIVNCIVLDRQDIIRMGANLDSNGVAVTPFSFHSIKFPK